MSITHQQRKKSKRWRFHLQRLKPMDRPCGEARPDYHDSLRHISSQAAARLAASDSDSSILCHIEFRPPVPRRKVPPPPRTADRPPPLPVKGEVNHGRNANLLHLNVPLRQKIGTKIITDSMRSKTVTHVPIHRPKMSETPQVPPRNRTSPKSPPRPLQALESTPTRAHNEYVDSPHTQKKITSGSEIMKQQAELKKEPVSSNEHKESIYCNQCGKCRCKSCTQPQVSQGKEHLTKRVVDVCSCMCCVKGIFYHCNDEEESGESDDPCACTGQPHCCRRWSAMALLSICLPCLCLYWPLKGCVTVCQSCYRRCSVRGCRCNRDRGTDGTQERYLMEESSST